VGNRRSEKREGGSVISRPSAQAGAPACPPPASAETRSRGFLVSGLWGGRKERGRRESGAAGAGLGCVYIELWGPRRRGGWFRLFGPVTGLVADTRTQPTKSRPGPGRGRRVSDCDYIPASRLARCAAWGTRIIIASCWLGTSGHGFVCLAHVICEWIWIPNFGR
jgi:hypothetical protein